VYDILSPFQRSAFSARKHLAHFGIRKAKSQTAAHKIRLGHVPLTADQLCDYSRSRVKLADKRSARGVGESRRSDLWGRRSKINDFRRVNRYNPLIFPNQVAVFLAISTK